MNSEEERRTVAKAKSIVDHCTGADPGVQAGTPKDHPELPAVTWGHAPLHGLCGTVSICLKVGVRSAC